MTDADVRLCRWVSGSFGRAVRFQPRSKIDDSFPFPATSSEVGFGTTPPPPSTPPMADAAAAPSAPRPPGDTLPESQRKRFLKAVSDGDHMAVVQAIGQGMPPDVAWRGMLPLRTAVLGGDVDMVAMLRRVGADPWLEPVARVENDVYTLAKSAHALATEMAEDEANPMASNAREMLRAMDDQEFSKARVVALQARLEEQVAGSTRMATYSIAFFVCVLLGSFAALHVLGVDDDVADVREL